MLLCAVPLALLRADSAARSRQRAACYLGMALLKGVLLATCVRPMADFVFSASDTSLRFFSTWVGALAWLFQSVLTMDAVLDLANALRSLLGGTPWTLMDNPLRADSVTEAWKRMRGKGAAPRWVLSLLVLAVWAPLQTGVPLLHLLPAVGAVALAALGLGLIWRMEKFLGGRATYVLFPLPIRLALTILVLGFLWAPLRCQSVAHVLQIWKALFGANSFLDTAPLLTKVVSMDRNMLLMALTLAVLLGLSSTWRWLSPKLSTVLASGAVALGSAFLYQAGAGADQPLPYLRSAQVATNGGLYHRARLTALMGRGTMPPQGHWLSHGVSGEGVRQSMLSFATELKQRDVPLIIVPLPLKLTLYPELITGSNPRDGEAPVFQLNEGALHDELTAAGATVLDLTETLLDRKGRSLPIYLEDDDRLRPDMVERVAEAIADFAKKQHPQLAMPTALLTDMRPTPWKEVGQLAQQAAQQRPAQSFTLTELPKISRDAASPIALLGDSHASFYGNASMAQHMAFHMGRQLDLYLNEAQPDEAMRRFSANYDDVVRQKKLVIWILGVEEMIQADQLAYRAGRRWQPAQFNSATTPPQAVVPLVTK
jgi:hypothetical protein